MFIEPAIAKVIWGPCRRRQRLISKRR